MQSSEDIRNFTTKTIYAKEQDWFELMSNEKYDGNRRFPYLEAKS
jgi:hypothetical protein